MSSLFFILFKRTAIYLLFMSFKTHRYLDRHNPFEIHCWGSVPFIFHRQGHRQPSLLWRVSLDIGSVIAVLFGLMNTVPSRFFMTLYLSWANYIWPCLCVTPPPSCVSPEVLGERECWWCRPPQAPPLYQNPLPTLRPPGLEPQWVGWTQSGAVRMCLQWVNSLPSIL